MALGLTGLLGGAVAAEETAGARSPALAVPRPSAGPETSTVGVRAGRAPDRLAIPSLAISAPIDSAHAEAGSLVLPADASRVARYDASPPLDARAGTTIVAGHVRNAAQRGALFPLATVRRGALVHTTDAAGRRRTWQVVSVDSPTKVDLPAGLFTASGPRRLAIITCGGTPVLGPDGTRHYPLNVVVVATPLAGD